jgi:serine/threonine-protein kinase RsbT
VTVRDEIRIAINSDTDIVIARQQGRALALRAGFGETDLTVISTAISEVARNIVEYASSGEIVLRLENTGSRAAMIVIARDQGPGIPDISLAMQDGYTSGRGLGLGLPGTRRLMDDFDITSSPGRGTIITMKKWRS